MPNTEWSRWLGPNPSREIARHYQETIKEVIADSRAIARPELFLWVTGRPTAFGNLAAVADSTDRVSIEEALSAMSQVTAPALIAFLNSPSPAVVDRLTDAGFIERHSPAMAVSVEAFQSPSVPEDWEIVEVTDGPTRVLWMDAAAQAFSMPLEICQGLTTSDPDTRSWMMVKNGRAACVAMLHISHSIPGIYCVGTVEEARGKGLGGALTAFAVAEAFRDGYEVCVLQASKMGYPVYLRLGFEDVGSYPTFLRM